MNKHIHNKMRDISEITQEEKLKKCIFFADDGRDEVGYTDAILYEDLGLTLFITKKYITEDEANTLKGKD